MIVADSLENCLFIYKDSKAQTFSFFIKYPIKLYINAEPVLIRVPLNVFICLM